jgi:hypothetical protein
VHATELVRPVAGDILPRLLAVIQAPDARSDENSNATENAISTLGSLCLLTTYVFRLWACL